LDATLYTSAEALRVITALLCPAMPHSMAKIWSQLGMPGSPEDIRLDSLAWGQLTPTQKIGDIEPVFPRIDAKPAIEKMRELEARESAREAVLLGTKLKASVASSNVSNRITDF